jgi:predicted transcriptional regulator
MMTRATGNTDQVLFDEDVHVKPIEFAETLGIRPQMVYNYIKNERFPDGTVVEVTHRTETTEGEGEDAVTTVKERVQKVLVRELAEEWAAEYLNRKQARAEKREAQLQAELAGEA